MVAGEGDHDVGATMGRSDRVVHGICL